MLTALSHADHWSRTNLRAGVIGMELSHTLTAVVMSEVDSPQLTENAVYGGFWADCGVRRSCTAHQGGKRGFGNGGPASQALSGERATAREAEKKIEFSVLECTRKTICHVPWGLRWAVLGALSPSFPSFSLLFPPPLSLSLPSAPASCIRA